MLSLDGVADVEGDAEAFRARLDLAVNATMIEYCVAATGHEPLYVDDGPEGRYRNGRVELRHGISLRRLRQRIGHELGHKFYEEIGYAEPDLEARCDLFGAAMCMPRDEVRRATRRVGHRVHFIADHFGVTQSVALLRLGEADGRPVMLLCDRGPIVRGAEFSWPSLSTLRRALERGRSVVHPVPISDEPNRIGLMASREAWALLSA